MKVLKLTKLMTQISSLSVNLGSFMKKVTKSSFLFPVSEGSKPVAG